MSNNESIDIKDINTTSELTQEEMDEVKGGATSGGTGGTNVNPAVKTGTGGTGGTGGTSSTSGVVKSTNPS